MMNKVFDLEAWLIRHSPPHKKLSGGEWLCDCPNCGRTAKLAVNVKKNKFQCWVCSFRGVKASHLISAYLGVAHTDAEEIVLRSTYGMPQYIESLETVDRVRKKRILPEILPPLKTTWKLDGVAKEYVVKRNISEENAKAFKLSSIVSDGTGSKADYLLRNRLLIPAFVDCRFVYWTARATDDHDKIKIINLPSSEMHKQWGLPHIPDCAGKNEVLIGLNLIRLGDPIILVEGPVDALVCGPGFVSCLGSRVSLQQAKLIASISPQSCTIMFDGDDAGRRGAIQAQAILSTYVPTSIAQCPEGLDPAVLGRSACIELSFRSISANHVKALF